MFSAFGKKNTPITDDYGKLDPKDSDRVFVDVVDSNSKFYFVQGEVLDPGRFPITGRETVLDAVNLAGGLTPQADHVGVVLVRNNPKDGSLKSLDIDIDEVVFGDDRLDQLFAFRPAIVSSFVAIPRPRAKTLIGSADQRAVAHARAEDLGRTRRMIPRRD